MKKIIISIFMIFSFLTYSKSNIQTLVSSDINLSNEYIEKSNLEIEKMVEGQLVKFKNVIKQMWTYELMDEIKNLEDGIEKEYTKKLFNKLEDIFIEAFEIKLELENISYISDNRVDVLYKIGMYDLSDMFDLFTQLENEKKIDRMLVKKLVEKLNPELDLLRLNLTTEKAIDKKMMDMAYDLTIEFFGNNIEEYKKNSKYTYDKGYVSLVKKENKWEELSFIRNEKSGIDFKVILNKDIKLSDEYIEKTKNEIFVNLKIDELVSKEFIKMVMKKYNLTKAEYDKMFSKYNENSEYLKKGIYFVNENNVVLKYEEKVLNYFSLYTDKEFIGNLKTKKDSEREKYTLNYLFNEKSATRLKKENNYIYYDFYVKLEKTNGTWEIKELMPK